MPDVLCSIYNTGRRINNLLTNVLDDIQSYTQPTNHVLRAYFNSQMRKEGRSTSKNRPFEALLLLRPSAIRNRLADINNQTFSGEIKDLKCQRIVWSLHFMQMT